MCNSQKKNLKQAMTDKDRDKYESCPENGTKGKTFKK